MPQILKFIHITKCAGSFIEDIGKEHNIEWGRFHKEYGFWHNNFIDVPKSIKEKYDWFVVVRNPYDRILSEYYCEWGGIGNKNITHNKEEFNNYLIDKIKNRQLHENSYHYSEQYKYIDNNINITIIKFENLFEELINLFEKYKIDINVNKYNKKINNKESKNSTILFNIDDFNTDLLTYINEVYDKDFILFNYEKRTV